MNPDDDVPAVERITFRRLVRDDFPLIGRWLAEPHVHRWWFHESSPEAVERDFGPTADGTEPAEDHIALLDGEPFGHIQYYRWVDYPEDLESMDDVYPVPPGAVSVDYFIGNPALTGRGFGPALIRAFIEQQVWPGAPEATCVIVPVVSANRASWRALEHAGFRLVARGELEPDNPEDDRSHEILRLDRPPLTRADVPDLTPVAMPVTLDPPSRTWTDQDWQRIRYGHLSSGMDDRWHGFVEDDRLFLHRSWTGNGIFEAQFVRSSDGWTVTELVVCGDPSRFKRSSDDTRLFERVVDGVLLGRLGP